MQDFAVGHPAPPQARPNGRQNLNLVEGLEHTQRAGAEG